MNIQIYKYLPFLACLIMQGCDVVAQEALDEAARLAGTSAQVTYHPPTVTVESPAHTPTPDPSPAIEAARFDRLVLVTNLLAQLCSFNGAEGRVVNQECMAESSRCVAEIDKGLDAPTTLKNTIACGYRWGQK